MQRLKLQKHTNYACACKKKMFLVFLVLFFSLFHSFGIHTLNGAKNMSFFLDPSETVADWNFKCFVSQRQRQAKMLIAFIHTYTHIYSNSLPLCVYMCRKSNKKGAITQEKHFNFYVYKMWREKTGESGDYNLLCVRAQI